MSIERIGSSQIMHNVVVKGDTLYLGGITAEDPTGDIYAQTKDLLKRADEILASAGSNKHKLLSATIFITDFSEKPQMNKAWSEWLDTADMPARATIGVANLGTGLLIEISFTATR
jgi:enamine deaminase RidA (YjgF/YER057c/UK114 family)